MLHYFLKSRYRFILAGLVLCVVGVWFYWYQTEQIASPTIIIYASGVALLNVALSFFSFTRFPYITRFLLLFSFVLLGLAAYGIYTVSRGVLL